MMQWEQAVTDFAKAILHGDEHHRAWLTEAAQCFIEGKPLPAPYEVKNLASTPRVDRNTFKATYNGKEIEVVYASFARCIERESNELRQTIAACKPAVDFYSRQMERSANSETLSETGKQGAKSEVERQGKLLDEIDRCLPKG